MGKSAGSKAGGGGGGGGAGKSIGGGQNTMKGSEKQIQWAEDIKSKMDLSTDGLTQRGKEIVDWVKKIDDAKWWIDNRDVKSSKKAIEALIAGTFINGKLHVLNPKTGKIVKKWSEIVSDGKGGHKVNHEVEVF